MKYIVEPSKAIEGYYGVRREDSSIYCYQHEKLSYCQMMLARYNREYLNQK